MMTTPNLTWTDAENRKWIAAIAFVDAVRLRDTQQIDLLDPKSIERLFSDPLIRIEAIAELQRAQWEKLQLNYSQFVDDAILSGERTFADATLALREAISDFFRRLDRRDLAIVADRAWTMMDREQALRMSTASGDKVGQILEASMTRAAAELDAELDRTLERVGSTSTSSPESADSTTDR
jgi:hypothetical protein